MITLLQATFKFFANRRNMLLGERVCILHLIVVLHLDSIVSRPSMNDMRWR